MRTRWPDESQLVFLGVDLLRQIAGAVRREVQTFPDGPVLFEHCNRFGFEGVLSKQVSSRHVSGPSRNWIKTKCPN
jgi:ATP-dependent DNA ligase